MPAANPQSNPPTEITQPRKGASLGSAMPQRSELSSKSIGNGSRTRFLSVKKFRFRRVGTMLAIGAVVVVLGFLTWAAIHLWG